MENIFSPDQTDVLLNNARAEFGNDLVLLKGDISGIQRFLFDVKSQGAAQELKARSLFIDILLHAAEKEISELLDGRTIKIINSGGNFYLFAENDKKFEDRISTIRKRYEELLFPLDIHLYLDSVPVNPSEEYRSVISALEKKMNLQKLQPWSDLKYFEVKQTIDIPEFRNLTSKINKWGIVYLSLQTIENSQAQIKFENSGMQLSLQSISFQSIASNNSIPLTIHVPRWDNELIEYNKFLKYPVVSKLTTGQVTFEQLSLLAVRRKVADNLCACAFDLDNMGEFLKLLPSFSSFKIFSKLIMEAFQESVSEILDTEACLASAKRKEKIGERLVYTEKKSYYKYHIYVVYCGGDDGFIVGPWNLVIEFINELKAKFNKKLNNRMDKPFSFSTAFVFFKTKLPIRRIAAMVAGNLHRAKESTEWDYLENSFTFLTEETRVPKKGGLNLFNITFTPDQWELIEGAKKDLESIIYGENDNTSKAILHRLRNFETVYTRQLESDKHGNTFTDPELYRISYSLRNLKKVGKGFEVLRFTENFEAYFIEGLTNPEKDRSKGYIMPVAARLIEWGKRTK